MRKYCPLVFCILLLIWHIPTNSDARTSLPFEVHIKADKVSPPGNSVDTTINAFASYPLNDATLHLKIPQMGVLNPETIILWQGSTDTYKRFKYDYTISGLQQGIYEVVALLKVNTLNEVLAVGHLYLKVTDEGIYTNTSMSFAIDKFPEHWTDGQPSKSSLNPSEHGVKIDYDNELVPVKQLKLEPAN